MTSTSEILKKLTRLYNAECIKNAQKYYLTRTGFGLYGTFHGLIVVNEGNGSVLTT